MNTFQNLIDNGIEPYTAQEMLDNYSSKIGTMNGVYEITDITYDFNERGRDVTLKCSLCGREIHRMMIRGRNKWSELIKSCPCEKEKIEKEYRERLRKEREEKQQLILSRINKIFGDYEIISVLDLESNNPRYVMRCRECGEEMNVSANNFWQRANFECRKHKPHAEPVIKFDKSYIGMKKNFLTVRGITRLPNGHRAFLCECDCGNMKAIEPTQWEQGIVKSCGCKHDELQKESHTKHGLSGTRLYGIWSNMNARCFNPNSQHYKHYGGRGITVCTQWKGEQGLLNFIDWANRNGYSDELSIDRIDVNGNYEPDNCRWADWYMQANNRRTPKIGNDRKKRVVKLFSINGDARSMKEWCVLFGTSQQAVYYRMDKLGMTLEQALKTPKMTDGRPRKQSVSDARRN